MGDVLLRRQAEGAIMSKIALATMAVLWAAAPTLAQTPSGAWAEKLFNNKISHEFGSVARGTVLKYSFPFKNIYAVPLEITELKPSCHCVKAAASKKVFQPQEEGTIDVEVDSKQFEGATIKNVRVTVGPQYVSTAVLYITATSRRDVVCNPGEVDFGIVLQGQQLVRTVDIEYAGYLDWKIRDVEKPADSKLDISIAEIRRQQPRGSSAGQVAYRMTVKLAADVAAGQLKHEITLRTNDPSAEVLTLSVSGNVQAPLQVAPKNVPLSTIKVGDAKVFRVQVTGNRPFLVTGIRSSEGNDVTAELPKEPQASHTVIMRLTPTNPGEIQRTVTILTNMGQSATVTFTIQARAEK
jgi:hypothetical protein